MSKLPDQNSYTEEEAQRRTEAALRAAFTMPPKRQSEMKVGKPRGKRAKSPGKRATKRLIKSSAC